MTRTLYCTTATARGLARALLLGQELRARHGDVDFRILVAEHPSVVQRLRRQLPQQTLVAPDEIGCPEWLHMAFCYDEWQLPAALQPAWLRALGRHGDVIYFDCDVAVHAPLDEIQAQLRDAAIVVAAHEGTATLARRWDRGPFNLGFLAIAGGDGPQKGLLDAFHAWMADPDPWYLHLSATFFAAEVAARCPKMAVLRPPRHGLAHWNAVDSGIRLDEHEQPHADAGPVLFSHYAGLLATDDGYRSRYPHDEAVPKPGSSFARLVQAYQERLGGMSPHPLAHQPYSFGAYVDGTPIAPAHRRAFLRLATANRRQIANPFAARGAIEQLCARSPEQIERMVRDQKLLIQSHLLGLPRSWFAIASTMTRLAAPQTHLRMFQLAHGVGNGWRRLRGLLSDGRR
jgi:hypothetical protein